MPAPDYPQAAINVRATAKRSTVTLRTRAACGHILEATARHGSTEHARAVAWRRLRVKVAREERRCDSWPWK